jgi:hypothetical protein
MVGFALLSTVALSFVGTIWDDSVALLSKAAWLVFFTCATQKVTKDPTPRRQMIM